MKKALVLVASVCAVSANADVYYDGFDMAIKHFSADHERNLQPWGPEHRFMQNALMTVAQKIPALAGIENIGQQRGNRYFSMLELSLTPFDANFGAIRDRVSPIVTELTAGCAYEKKTEVREVRLSMDYVTTTVTHDFILDALGNHKCQSASVDVLKQEGVRSIKLVESDERYSANYAVQFGKSGTSDMEYVKKQLLKSPSLSALVAEMKVPGTNEMTIGDGDSFAITKTSGKATLSETFEFTFRKGWGDCPAGCISSHTWKVEVKPVISGPVSAETIGFEVRVLEETGDALPTDGDIQ